MPNFDLGESIPPDTAHAVSVSLPTWKANVGYEENESWVVSKMTTGYPRFFIHKTIEAFAKDVAARYGSPASDAMAMPMAMLFPTRKAAGRCVEFMRRHAPSSVQNQSGVEVVSLVLDLTNPASAPLASLHPSVSAVLFRSDAFQYAKQYWQHSGDGVSSRRAEFCHGLFKDGLLVRNGEGEGGGHSRPQSPEGQGPKACKGPKRYRRPMSIASTAADHTNANVNANSAVDLGRKRRASDDKDLGGAGDVQETSRFLEERFGRNLDLSFLEAARSAIRRRIAGALRGYVDLSAAPLPEARMEANTRGIANLREEDVYLFPCGMNAIFHAHRFLMAARGSMRSINFGFPYVDTLKILQKFGPGCQFYGHASESDLDELETHLAAGERFLALFCEFPGNPLLTCPNLVRIRHLAEVYDFAVVVDETIGTFANVNVLQYADIVISSLTKIFSGDSNVMGGSAIVNPNSRYYAALKHVARDEYEDTYWPEDIIFMERNSRDFVARIDRTNSNAEAACDLLVVHPLIKKIYYPKYNESRPNYEICKLSTGGYGGLCSVVFHKRAQAVAFYDAIDTAKGPSLGTNFTLTSPYVILAHYNELDWAAGLGVEPHLIRISVGLEETDQIIDVFRSALAAAENASAE